MTSSTLEEDTKNIQLGAVIFITNLFFLFLILSDKTKLNLVMFYLMMFDGSIIASYIVFREETADALKLTIPSAGDFIRALLVGFLLALFLIGLERNGAGQIIYQSVNFGGEYSAIVNSILFAFVIGIGEETLVRGFLSAIAEEFTDGTDGTQRALILYVLNPTIFSLMHFFMWSSNYIIEMGMTMIIFMFFYHFIFAEFMQVLKDKANSLYAPISAHAFYDGIKMIMLTLG